jgi:hypothetical protein
MTAPGDCSIVARAAIEGEVSESQAIRQSRRRLIKRHRTRPMRLEGIS